MKSILDRSFRYVPSYETDLRKTFERIRKEREPTGRPRNPDVVHLNRDKKSA
jgi:hypothetical protein